jgi:hypothetical protein
MELELKLKAGTLTIKQFEVITGKVIDSTEKALSDYTNAVISDANTMIEFEGISELIDKVNKKETLTSDDFLKLQLQALKCESLPTSSKVGREAVYNLAISATDQSQMTTEEKKTLKDYNVWESQDLSKVGEYVNFFRKRLRGRN